MNAADLPVALLAGGLATRLRPITERIPKVLVEVAGEPFLHHQLRLLAAAGLRRVVLCLGHLGEQVVERYGSGSAFGLRLDYCFDGPTLLGTAGALIRALPTLGPAFYVLYGDSYLPVDYRAVGDHFLRSGAPGLMTVYENRGRFERSNVEFAGETIVAYNKRQPTAAMNHVDYGLGAFRAEAFDGYPRDAAVDLADVQQALAARGQLAGHLIAERFYEIGSPAGLQELDAHLRTSVL
jgi:NDP-sugar pyrophosphorylase family protein